MCAPNPPPAPDYNAAAQAQGQANIEAAKISNKMNNPNVVSPYGTQTVTYGSGFNQAGYDKAYADYQKQLESFNNLSKQTYDPNEVIWGDPGNGYRAYTRQDWATHFGVPLWQINANGGYPIQGPKAAPSKDAFTLGDPNQPTLTQTFSPEQQKLFDQSNQVKELLGGLGIKGASVLGEVIGKNTDFSGLPAAPGSAEDTRTKVINAMMSRVNEDTDRQKATLNSNLVAAGIRPGTKAYDDQMNLLNRQVNDARNQAFLASGQEMTRDFATDTQRRKDALAEYLTQRQIPLNEITALMSGSQVSNPFAVPGYAQNTQVQASPIFAAQNALAGYNTDIYNAQAAQRGNLMQGLFGLGGAGLQAGGAAGGFGNLF